MTDGRMARLDEWLRENCDEYCGGGECNLPCDDGKRGPFCGETYFCCYMGCKCAPECRERGAVCEAIEPPEELLGGRAR